MRASFTLLPVIVLFAAIAVFSYSTKPQTKPVSGTLRFCAVALLFAGGLIFIPGLLILLSQLTEPGHQYAASQMLSVWLLVGALLLGTGLLIHAGRFSLKVLLCLVLFAATLSSIPVLVWGD